MRTALVPFGLVVSFLAPLAAADNKLTQAEIDDGWISLFDGETLFGWKAQGKVDWQVKDGAITYEYNQFIVQRTKIRSTGKLPVGKAKVEVVSKLAGKVGGAMDVTIKVNDKVIGQGQVPTAISLHFTTNESFDIGSDTSSPVSLDYYDKAPFAFNGKIGQTVVKYPKK